MLYIRLLLVSLLYFVTLVRINKNAAVGRRKFAFSEGYFWSFFHLFSSSKFQPQYSNCDRNSIPKFSLAHVLEKSQNSVFLQHHGPPSRQIDSTRLSDTATAIIPAWCAQLLTIRRTSLKPYT